MKTLLRNRMNLLILYSLCCCSLTFAQTDTISIDFGDNLSPLPWNNIANPIDGAIDDLANQKNAETGISVNIFDAFNNINTAGTQEPDPSIEYPATATGDSFFGNVATFGGQEQPTAGLIFSNLDPTEEYEFSFFASRTATDNREAQYVLTGASEETVFLNASSNTDMLAISKMTPNSSGEVSILVSPGPNNDNSSGFYYLGAMKVVYPEPEIVLPIDTILIDFGNDLSPLPWNNMADPVGGQIDDLLMTNSFNSGKGIAIYDAFNNINTAGTQEPDPSIGVPPTASGDSFFGNVATFGGQEQPTAGIRLSNFDADKEIEISFFASRVATDNREAQYAVHGLTSDTEYLDAASNIDQLASTFMVPKADGTIDIDIMPGPNNSNGSGFYYLGAMKIMFPNEQVTNSELSVISPNGGESWQVGKMPKIKWKSKNNIIMTIEYSSDNGGSWNHVADVPAISQQYIWAVPNDPTEEALIRLTTENLTTTSENVFTISDDTTNCNIVILGSSTAEGAGATPKDSSWVNLYADHLTQRNTKYNIINLGKGGFTTFHILPDGTDIPSGVSVNIDETRNITEALSYDPSVIIVNMPSNDAASNYGVDMQLENFKLLYDTGVGAGTEMYISTTQPRNFSNDAQVQIQKDVRDSIFAIYGDHALDFWTVLADADGFILPDVDSGDGVHVNNKGHKALFNQALGKQIDTLECESTVGIFEKEWNPIQDLIIYPNPFLDQINLEFYADQTGSISIQLFDNLGRRIVSRQLEINNPGFQTFHVNDLNVDSASSSIIHLQLSWETKDGIRSISKSLISK